MTRSTSIGAPHDLPQRLEHGQDDRHVGPELGAQQPDRLQLLRERGLVEAGRREAPHVVDAAHALGSFRERVVEVVHDLADVPIVIAYPAGVPQGVLGAAEFLGDEVDPARARHAVDRLAGDGRVKALHAGHGTRAHRGFLGFSSL